MEEQAKDNETQKQQGERTKGDLTKMHLSMRDYSIPATQPEMLRGPGATVGLVEKWYRLDPWHDRDIAAIVQCGDVWLCFGYPSANHLAADCGELGPRPTSRFRGGGAAANRALDAVYMGSIKYSAADRFVLRSSSSTPKFFIHGNPLPELSLSRPMEHTGRRESPAVHADGLHDIGDSTFDFLEAPDKAAAQNEDLVALVSSQRSRSCRVWRGES
ncbi:hypothetical protein K438DRAFT_1771226 [Mycena galopus ATCC 62051]|nr:hypothetical protein K438DRAFT_1771226 [Mycena galopus ATCC 62051]